MIEQNFVKRIAQELSIQVSEASNAIALLDGGATIPFIVRYRKDATGDLAEAALEAIADQNAYFVALTNRRTSIIEALARQGRLTDDLRARLEACYGKIALEELYQPFKKRRLTRATVARQKGLEPLADVLWSQEPSEQDIEAAAAAYVLPEKTISSVEEALEGARAILSERIVWDPDGRAMIRTCLLREGRITSRSTKNAEGKKTKFETYYDFTEPVATIPSYRLLAVLRGVKMGILRMDVAIDDERMVTDLLAHFLHTSGSPFEAHVRQALEDAYHRHLRPALEHEVVGIIRQRAEEDTIRRFQANTRGLLLAPPAGPLIVLGVEPGLRTGCQLAVVDKDGTYLESQTIHPHAPANDHDGAERVAIDLVKKHGVQAIAVGNGTASSETGQFLSRVLAKEGLKEIACVSIGGSGAAAYATSRAAQEEFPDLDPTVRGAIAIARRFQDPLAELVKVEPRHIGVGQYQHDVNQRQLRDKLHRTVVSCVNQVGVDLNTVSAELLRYVSGMQMGTAQNVVAYRTQQGRFTTRRQLEEIDGIGPKVFEQCAGFLRLPDAENPLDATAIHPEAYPVVEQIAASVGVTVSELIRNRENIDRVDFAQFENDTVGVFTLKGIRHELLRPGHDPRGKFRVPKFLEGVHAIDDLEEGMETEGVVTNVTDFGAFVDVGIHLDGLVHLSELANRFVVDPRQVVKVGQVVRVKIIKVEKGLPRLSLSMKAVVPVKRHPRRPPPVRRGAPSQATRDGADPKAKEHKDRPADGDRKRPSRASKPRERDTRPPRARKGGDRHAPRPARPRTHADSSESLNTLLADQLAAIRDKFNH